MDVLSHSQQLISQPILRWFHNNFTHLDYDHVNYSCINILQGAVQSVLSDEQGYLLGWCQELTYEQVLHLKEGYQHYPAIYSMYEPSSQSIHKLDLIRVIDQGIEIFSFGYKKILQVSDYFLCEEAIAILAYEWTQVFGLSTHIHEPKKEIYETTQYLSSQQHQLRGLIWTTLELCIIRGLYSMKSLTEIALENYIQPKEVEHSLMIIKRKLGDQNMTPATLFKKLKRKGVFQLCMSCYV